MYCLQRTRKCSIVTEEEDEDDDGATSDSSLHSSLNRRGSRSEGKLNLAVQELRKDALAGTSLDPSSPGTPVCSISPQHPSSKMLPAPLVSARSSPQLGLDEISEDGTIMRSGSSTPRNFLSFEQRRSRFRKSRTASCSSSEASDEDSEGRKKRGSTKSLHRQREPRDPSGNGGSASGNAPPPHGSEHTSSGSGSSDGGANGNGGASEPRDPSAGGSTSTGHTSVADSADSGGGRRHCLYGRHRRRVETRLRESQSLNRITEVQECEPQQPLAATTVGTTAVSLTTSTTPPLQPRQSTGRPSEHADRGAAKTSSANGGGTLLERLVSKKERIKKNAIIGKCINLRRKLCMPLLKRGRLYKTQSCTEVHSTKDINQNVKSTLKISN